MVRFICFHIKHGSRIHLYYVILQLPC